MRLSKKQKQIQEFLFSHMDRLGIDSDEEIAKKTGVKLADVVWYRHHLGIRTQAEIEAKAKEEAKKAVPLIESFADLDEPKWTPPPPPERLRLEDICLDGGTQQRAQLTEEAVEEYAEALRQGRQLPPVVVFLDDTSAGQDGPMWWLVDGFHRVEAHRRAGLTDIAVEVRSGTRRAAILASVGVNASHGVRRTNLDKRRAVLTLLQDEEWGLWPNRKIADLTGTTQQFVGKVRRELADGVEEPAEIQAETVSSPGIGPTWSWDGATTKLARLERVPRVSSPAEATALLEEPGLQKEVRYALQEQRRELETILQAQDFSEMMMSARRLGQPLVTDGRIGQAEAWLRRAEQLSTWPVEPLSVGELAEQCGTMADIEEHFFRRGMDPERWALLGRIAHSIHYMGLESGHSRGYIRSIEEMLAMGADTGLALPPGLRRVAEQRLRELQEAAAAAALRAPAREPYWAAGPKLLKAGEAAIQACDDPMVLGEAGRIAQDRNHAQARPELRAVIRARLVELNAELITCPSPRCEGAWYREGYTCPACGWNAQTAMQRWAEAVDRAPRLIADQVHILQLAGKPIPAELLQPAPPPPADTRLRLLPVGMMEIAWVGEVRDLAGLGADELRHRGESLSAWSSVVIMAGPDAGGFQSMISYEMHLCLPERGK